MDSLNKSTLKTSRGIKYTYYASPAKGTKPTILLLHGWPDQASLWAGLVNDHLVPAGYGAIALDCLGYNGTDKPLDPEDYTFDKQTADVCEILDKEGVDKAIPLGHDWGSTFAQRVYIYHPERCIGLITLNVSFRPQTTSGMDLDAMVKPMEEQVGYFPFWYWYLFGHPSEGPEIIGAHIESMWTVMHGPPESWRDLLCAKDGIKNWLKADKKQPVQSYATEDSKQEFIKRFDRDGFKAPLMWYRSQIEGYQGAEELKLPKERFVLQVPYLFVAGLKDVVCLPAAINEPKALGLVPKLTQKNIDGGHWSMLSHPKEMGEAIVSWLHDTY